MGEGATIGTTLLPKRARPPQLIEGECGLYASFYNSERLGHWFDFRLDRIEKIWRLEPRSALPL